MRRALPFLWFLLACGCARDLRATLDSAEGLAPGSRVYAAGIAIGKVERVQVEGERAEVRFSLEPGHTLSLRLDACALSLPSEGGALLLVFPGKDLEPLRGPLAPCDTGEHRLTSLKNLAASGGGALGLSVRRFLEGLAVATAPADEPTGRGPCGALTVSRLRTEQVAAVPLLLPTGGRRLWLSVENRGGAPVSLETATFIDQRGTVARQAHLPEDDDLFMSLAIPAHTTREVSAVFAGARANQVSAVEVEASFIDSATPDGCRVRWRL